jgi:hypothetical protein
MKDYTSFRHDFALEELAKEKVGSGEPCGYFVSIGNGVYQNDSDDLIPFEGSEEDVSYKMIAYFSELEDAQNCADNIYIGEDTNIGWVRIEDQGGEMHWRFVEAVPTTKYVSTILNGPL